MYNVGNENKNECCKCNELAEKLAVCLKDNEKLAKMMRDLRLENEELNKTLQNRPSGCNDSRSGTARDEKGYKEKFEALVEIHHGWKKDYEELQMRYEMLKGEKRLLEDEEKELKIRINELEKRQGPLEGELTKLATALYRGSTDREKIHEEKEKYKSDLQDAEKIIRELTAEVDACKAREEAHRRSWSENGYLDERISSALRHQLQYVYPYHSVDQGWRLEQQRRGVLPGFPDLL